MEAAGRDAAAVYHHDSEDGAQEAWLIACEHWQHGYPPAEVLRLVKRDLVSRWSRLRQDVQDDPRAPPRSRSTEAEVQPRRGQSVPITSLDRLLAHLTASTLGGQLDRLSVHASLHCPDCGRGGHWQDWTPRGCREAQRKARGWLLSAQADADGMQTGTPTAGGNRVEETRAAQGIAGSEPVWVCGEPWGLQKHWTRNPIAVLREGGDPGDGMKLDTSFGDTGRVEREFVKLCDELAMERRRERDVRWQRKESDRPARLLRLTNSTSPASCTSASAQLRSG